MNQRVKKIALVGASGRMGQRVRAILEADYPQIIVSLFDQGDALSFTDVDVVIDFSMPSATRALCMALSNSTAALVTGVTGRSQEETDDISGMGTSRPVLIASNFSFGVHVLNHLVNSAARILDSNYQIEIVESHHQYKQDMPSGTAITLSKSAADGRGLPWHDVFMDRGGSRIRNTADEIGVTGYRGGNVIGDHHVHFLGPQERIELSHSASNRDVFAEGAIRSALWVMDRKPGLYTMGDIVAEQLESLDTREGT